MNNKLSLELKRRIYNSLKELGNICGKYVNGASYNDLNIVDFLNQIWDLATMKSEDPRFKNALGDAIQHLVNNDDWDLDTTFLSRFNLLAGKEEFFIKFLEAVVAPSTRESREEIEKYVDVINDLLRGVKCELIVFGYIDDMPQYRFSYELKNIGRLPSDIPHVDLCVYTDNPLTFPCFELEECLWDDFGYRTRFILYYYSSKDEIEEIGFVKILDSRSSSSYGMLPSKFSQLDTRFISLGQSPSYYENINKCLKDKSLSFLYAMNDVACFPKLREGIENSFGYTQSLLRYDEANQALKLAQYIISGYELEDKINFIFKAQMPYHDSSLNIRFNFGSLYHDNSFTRIIAIIGNNGAGKTTVLSQLAEAIVENKKDRFLPHPPLFSKVLATSYSIFDKFFKNTKSSFNYQYCGIQKSPEGLMTEDELSTRRHHSLDLISSYGRNRDLESILCWLLGKDLFNTLLSENEQISEDCISRQYSKLSSGQSMLMNLTIEMLAHIRSNTLILIDEPEVHLHPRGITNILKIIDRICEKYNSCCVMATHSSIIVQQLLSKNVIILDRDVDGSPVVRGMSNESFAENLTTITDDIFGRNDVEPLYYSKLKKLAKTKIDINTAIKLIQNRDIPVNMHLYLLLDNLLGHEEHES